MPFRDVPLVYLVADGIPAAGDQQPKEYLGTGVLAVLGEPAFAQIILFRCFKIKRGHIIKADGYVIANHHLGIRVSDVLHTGLEIVWLGLGFRLRLWGTTLLAVFALANRFYLFLLILLAVAQVVEKAVNLIDTVCHMQVTLHVIHALQLAARIEQTANDDIAEQPALDGSVSDTVVERAENQFRTSHLYLGVAQAANEVIYYVLFFVYVWQSWPRHLLQKR